jgi:hypothetical protein
LHKKKYGKYPSEVQALHPYYEIWTDYISHQVLNGYSIFHDETLYILLSLPVKSKDYILSLSKENFL